MSRKQHSLRMKLERISNAIIQSILLWCGFYCEVATPSLVQVRSWCKSVFVHFESFFVSGLDWSGVYNFSEP